MNGIKGYFANHARASAALVSLGVHAVLIVVALSFVAVTVIKKHDQKFEAKPVSRPTMQLKKLQVPVNIKKKKMQKPKLRKRIVVQPKMNQTMPDIKVPELTGVKGGLGSAGGGGLGGVGSLGFTIPEFEIFGVKGRGEKVFLILDSSGGMMIDEMGGIPAYTIIKEELIRIVDELPSTALFSVAVYDRKCFTLFPQMVAASPANTAELKAWLEPLNAVSEGMGDKDYGSKTLGKGGVERKEEPLTGKFEENGQLPSDRAWPLASMLAMEEQADTVFLLTGSWGNLGTKGKVDPKEIEAWNTSSAKKKYEKNMAAAKKKLEEENRARAANGQPPRVLNGNGLLDAYFPGTPLPPQAKGGYIYTPHDFADAYYALQKRDNTVEAVPTKSGLSGRRKKSSSKPVYSLNVIHFVRKGEGNVGRAQQHFTALAKLCDGEYRTIAGMDTIESYIIADAENQ